MSRGFKPWSDKVPTTIICAAGMKTPLLDPRLKRPHLNSRHHYSYRVKIPLPLQLLRHYCWMKFAFSPNPCFLSCWMCGFLFRWSSALTKASKISIDISDWVLALVEITVSEFRWDFMSINIFSLLSKAICWTASCASRLSKLLKCSSQSSPLMYSSLSCSLLTVYVDWRNYQISYVVLSLSSILIMYRTWTTSLSSTAKEHSAYAIFSSQLDCFSSVLL